MRPCIECGMETAGSIGAAGIKWTGLCQPCKDKADLELATSIAAYAAACDFMMPRIIKSFSSATSAVEELLTPPSPQPTPTTPEAA